MFEYVFCDDYDEAFFDVMCQALENQIPGLKKGQLLVDVDCSQVQLYSLGDKNLSVCNSTFVEDVHVRSEFDLAPYLARLPVKKTSK